MTTVNNGAPRSGGRERGVGVDFTRVWTSQGACHAPISLDNESVRLTHPTKAIEQVCGNHWNKASARPMEELERNSRARQAMDGPAARRVRRGRTGREPGPREGRPRARHRWIGETHV